MINLQKRTLRFTEKMTISVLVACDVQFHLLLLYANGPNDLCTYVTKAYLFQTCILCM